MNNNNLQRRFLICDDIYSLDGIGVYNNNISDIESWYWFIY